MQAVTAAVGIGVITKSGKLAEGVSDVGKQIGKNSREKLEEFITKSLQDKLEIINNHWQVKYPDVFTRGSFFEDLMGVYRYKKADGWYHTGDISFNVKGVDFYKGTRQGKDIFADIVVSMKTTIKTDVNEWLKYKSIQDNIKFLREGKSSKGMIDPNNKLTMYINSAEIHIFMQKTNITSELKTNWMNKLNAEYPDIKFEIKAIEDFIN
ncbi:hypothetical protein [Myroides sp. WP-1]|uniref:hypothetical protein n=1 Tax=Myroides sp. WP-1 TaxID=2759944 RepID=UPI0015FA34DB|nr:hypothetical protein [Myroides sp. WP-1]MBB1140661.1 hypothetical protein [Myroides sp. WP-1]